MCTTCANYRPRVFNSELDKLRNTITQKETEIKTMKNEIKSLNNVSFELVLRSYYLGAKETSARHQGNGRPERFSTKTLRSRC
jgi:hypothetical protein